MSHVAAGAFEFEPRISDPMHCTAALLCVPLLRASYLWIDPGLWNPHHDPPCTLRSARGADSRSHLLGTLHRDSVDHTRTMRRQHHNGNSAAV